MVFLSFRAEGSMGTGNNFINLIVILESVAVNINSASDVTANKILSSVEHNARQTTGVKMLMMEFEVRRLVAREVRSPGPSHRSLWVSLRCSNKNTCFRLLQRCQHEMCGKSRCVVSPTEMSFVSSVL